MEPKEVFDIFLEICKVPRPSKHEEQISAWLVDFARKHQIDCVTDEAMNVIMRKPATPGMENRPGIILQAHMDMVCEKNNDTVHDFTKDAIETYVEDGWLRARGTTLGADNGIGIAMALAAMTCPDVKHPAMECLFTVDEETGLTGANLLKDGYLQGKRLINLDSEDDGQIFIGCAGGVDTLAKLYYTPEPITTPLFAAEIGVSGLMGGHSGDDINKGRGNANKVLVRFLYNLLKNTKMHLVSINGGNLRNAIAREASAIVLVPFAYKEQLRIDLNNYIAEVEAELGDVEKDLRITLSSVDANDVTTIIPDEVAKRLLQSLYACPHGMMAMSKDMPGLVETSTNLASVKMRDGFIEINTSQRSSVESQKHSLKLMVECALALSGAEISHGDGYPGWKPNVNSELLGVTRQAYVDITGQEPEVKAIHAGLECGLFLEKYPYLDMVSIGPQMTGVHSPAEQLNLESTAKTWRWLKRVLETL